MGEVYDGHAAVMPFAAAEQYGGPWRASVAMAVAATSISGKLPDPQHVDAMARNIDPHKDLQTTLGVACSLTERGDEVCFVGQPSPAMLKECPEQVDHWLQILYDRSNAHVIESPPTATLLQWLLQERERPWSIILHAAGAAFKAPEQIVQPTVVVAASSPNSLTVHNPGSRELALLAHRAQLVGLRAALGSGSEVGRRVSLLAVRPRAATGSKLIINAAIRSA